MLILKQITKGKVPVKIYTDDIEHEAYQQLLNISQLPIIYSHVAAMPDVYFGKGAIRAGVDEIGIIPGSMGAKSFIVQGKGNKESFCSCSHGAGRKMRRGKAKRHFSVDDMVAQTEGVVCVRG